MNQQMSILSGSITVKTQKVKGIKVKGIQASLVLCC